MMGKPKPGKEGQVTLTDFEALVRAAGGSAAFSAHEIKTVFRRHAIDPLGGESRTAATLGREPYIPLTGHGGNNFKDLFMPATRTALWGDSLMGPEVASRASAKPDDVS